MKAQRPLTVPGDQRSQPPPLVTPWDSLGESSLCYFFDKNYTNLASLTDSFTATWLSHHHRLEYPKAVLYL